MIRLLRQNLAAMPTPAVPRGFAALQALPEGLLAAMLRRFPAKPDSRTQRTQQRHACRALVIIHGEKVFLPVTG